MKICFVTPTLGKGGLERVVSVLSDSMVDIGHQVDIITLTSDIVEYNINNKIRIHHLNEEFRYRHCGRQLLLWDLSNSLHRISPDVVLSFSETFNPLAIIAAKLNKQPVFAFDRSSPVLKRSMRDNILRSLTYRKAEAVVVQTQYAKKIYDAERANKHILVLANPLITFCHSEINSSPKRIVTTGRLIPSKNQKELIEIFDEINMPEWELYIAGDGPERYNLQKYISKLKTKDRIYLMGRVDDIESVFREASIFAYTSLSEGFPNAVSEALAFPLATIAYDCVAGVSEIIQDNRNGYLVAINDKHSFTERLRELMAHEDHRYKLMNESIKNRSKYDSKAITQKLISYILQYGK